MRAWVMRKLGEVSWVGWGGGGMLSGAVGWVGVMRDGVGWGGEKAAGWVRWFKGALDYLGTELSRKNVEKNQRVTNNDLFSEQA